jgi:2,3-bisphosphoglycerate-independent phosphoglycerate mutase
MLKKLMLTMLLAMALLSGCCHAEKNAVLVIVDGLGSTYVYPGRIPYSIDGSPLAGANLDFIDNATARYELWVPTPETESGNAVIATGYSEASGETITYYDATIYDALHARGYLSIAIMETGDTVEMVAEPDIIAYERNNSIYNPDVAIAINSPPVPPGIEDILRHDPPARLKTGYDSGIAYRQYDDWSLYKAIDIVSYMGRAYPGQEYLLVVNVAGTDMAAQERGYDAYRKAIEGLGEGLSLLADTCRSTGTVMVVTADHGMGFKTPDAKGSHASGAASMQNETRLAPFLIFNGEKGNASGVFGQQCLAPTLLSLMECPDTLSVADGVPVPVNERPSLYLINDEPVIATVESPGFYRQVTVNETCRIGPMDAGSYRLTLPWGVRTVDLEHDVTIRLADTMQGGMSAVSWVPYAAAAVVSAAGIALGLGLMRRK